MSSPDSVRRAVLRVIMIRMDNRLTITVRTQQGPVMAHMEIAGCRTAARIRTVLKAIITALMKTGRGRAPYAAPPRSDVWKKGIAASSLRMNSSPKEPGPQLLAIAEDAFCM